MKNVNIHTNYKYLNKGMISRRLVNGFNNTLSHIFQTIDFNSMLDIGCGEGIVLLQLKEHLKTKKCVGVDVDPLHIEKAKINAPYCDYVLGDIYEELNLETKKFDLVTCLEVLEHLEYPDKALKQIQKLASKYIIISAPREPVWRLMNMVRGKYWKALGNTPGHLNHWSSNTIKKLAKEYFNVLKIYQPLPWTILLCEIKNNND